MEPLDLCVRPYLCIVCKLRFWTELELEQHTKSSRGCRPSVILHTRMFETNQNLNSQSPPIIQEPNTVSQLSNDPGHKELDQIPKTKSTRKRISKSLLGIKSQSSYLSRVPFLQKRKKRSQNSSVSSHSESVQSDKIISIPGNILPAQFDKTNQFLNSPNILFNQELHHQPQNSSNLLNPGPFQIINIVNPTSILNTLLVGGSLTPHSAVNFNQNPIQLNQTSTVLLQSSAVQMLQNTASITENISLNHNVKTNQISSSPSVHVNVNLNLPSQSLSNSSNTSKLENQEKTTSNQTDNSLTVGESPNSCSPSVSVNQGQNQLSRNLSISMPLGLAQVSGSISFSANISQTRNALSNQFPILNSILINQKPNQISQNSDDSLHRKSVNALPIITKSFSMSNLHSLEDGESQTPISPNDLISQDLNQKPGNSSESLDGRSVLPKKTKSFSTSILNSLAGGESQTSDSPSVPFNQGPNQLSKSTSVSLPTELCKEPDKKVSIPKYTSHMQIAGTNQIPISKNLSLPNLSNQRSQNSGASLVLTHSGLIPVQKNNTLMQANNSHSWCVGSSQKINSPSAPSNQEKSGQSSNVLVKPGMVPDNAISLQKPDISTKEKLKNLKKKIFFNHKRKFVIKKLYKKRFY